MTANAMPEDRMSCLEAGMDDYVTKPVKVDILRDTMERWLSQTTTRENREVLPHK
jgi:polar amino acid transport system substrate-binding protein